MKSKLFQVMPCFSTGMPVSSDAIVGRRCGGATAAADQVTEPSFTSRLSTGIDPLLSDSCPRPSSTNRITCSGCGGGGVAALAAYDGDHEPETAANAATIRDSRPQRHGPYMRTTMSRKGDDGFRPRR